MPRQIPISAEMAIQIVRSADQLEARADELATWLSAADRHSDAAVVASYRQVVGDLRAVLEARLVCVTSRDVIIDRRAVSHTVIAAEAARTL